MASLWRQIQSGAMFAACLVFALVAYALLSADMKTFGVVFAVLAIASLILAFRIRGRSKRGTTNDLQLRNWKRAKAQDVKRPRDKRTKYCLENIGKDIVIKYHGKKRTIRPLRVYTKPKYRKTYVDAESDGEKRTFNIDDISI